MTNLLTARVNRAAGARRRSCGSVRSMAAAKDPDERCSTTGEMAMAVPTESPSERS